ncbi:hypothetical protein DTO013E5_8267 [Penicillium roqueforti]|uniref:Uncharacterized protein n=1 Tax=Penicillium roqueforti (strain FM164) TaxID=1365484 RepID=W6QM86_PENRF|nr:hypothetical protein CBS147355_9607 [Penicillium roqueforti]CDM37963.1 unnamed protein product [Penicillium roqueforti FM164]KAI2685036.1 hypothetical protein LCP963914a_5128 [Penicillium roqueforti]KAI2697268.1 hypothetical protein CBS147372_8006 [Penicillium roqueforti]KAI2708088.1 hypothetical protein CBS147318_9692 [Penicillium roqueforti]
MATYSCVQEHPRPVSQIIQYRGRQLRQVHRTTSTLWGSRSVAEARALIEPQITQENEQLFRTYHPAFSSQRAVCVLTQKDSGKDIWVVPENSHVPFIKAGGREIHIQPAFESPVDHDMQYCNIISDPIRRDVDVRQAFTPEDIKCLRAAFPRSIGAFIYQVECVVILFSRRDDMLHTWNFGTPPTVGRLTVGYTVLAMQPSAATAESGQQLARMSNAYEVCGVLGLKIRLPDHTEAITVPTHAFVRLPGPPTFFTRVASFYKRVTQSLTRFQIPLRLQNREVEVSTTPSPLSSSPIGKQCWLAGTNRRVGLITRTYDDPSSTYPYPSGYRHDLSLITGDNLIDIHPPKGIEMVPEWASYKDAIQGAPMIACVFDYINNEHGRLLGDIPNEQIRAALLEGHGHIWIQNAVDSSASILWRTDEDQVDARGFSGSVLCIGRVHEKCRPLLFQNFQLKITVWPDGECQRNSADLPPGLNHPNPMIKGGFILPDEIRTAKILLRSVRRQRQNLSDPVSSEIDQTVPNRKQFSDPF